MLSAEHPEDEDGYKSLLAEDSQSIEKKCKPQTTKATDPFRVCLSSHPLAIERRPEASCCPILWTIAV
jgi:hypothetical protein